MHIERDRIGFTLLELLVVIGIIAIITAIAFPVYMHVKAKGRQTQCLSNLRQLGQASLMYAQDNNGVFPPYDNTTRAFINDPNVGIPSPVHLRASLDSLVRNEQVWFCPSDPYSHKDIDKWGINHKYSSYDFNFRWNGRMTVNGIVLSRGRIVIEASRCLLIYDANGVYGLHLKNASEEDKQPGCQHFEGINIVYVDGHAKWRKASSVE